VTVSGVDSCSIAFRVAHQDWSDLLLSKPHVRTAHGGVIFRQAGPGGTKLGAHGRGLVWWEGRLDALLTDSARSWNLRPASDVPAAAQAAAAAFSALAGEPMDYGLQAPQAEVRRFDLAHEFGFEDGREGLAFLRTLAGMCPPRRKLNVWKGADGQPQTVYGRFERSGVVDFRLYDKGVESGSHPPGERLRYEVQRRPPRSRRHRPEVIGGLDLRGEFGRSIRPYLEGGSVIAAGTKATVGKLAQQAAAGEMSIAKAERLAGTVEFLREYGRAIYGDERKARRRLQGLREAGIALEDELPPDRVVPVGELLREAVESFRA
jgi:hypothetical protein